MAGPREISTTEAVPRARDLAALREAVYRRDAESGDLAAVARERAQAFMRRVDLLAAIAAADADPAAQAPLLSAIEAVRAESLHDPSTVLDVALGLLVADRPDEAAAVVLEAADTSAVRPVSDRELDDVVDRLTRPSRQEETRKLLVALLDRLLEGEHVIEAVLDVGRGTAVSALPGPRRRVLRAAVEVAERYLRDRPDDDPVRVALAAGQVLLGRPAEALSAVDAVLARDEDPRAHLVRVAALARLGRYADAISALWAALGEGPGDDHGSEIDALLSRLLSAADRPQEAVRVAEEGLRRGGSEADLLIAEAEGLAKTGETKKALEVLDGLLASKPDAVRALFARAGILEREGQSQDALETARRLVVAAPEDVETHLLLARLLAATDDADGSLAALDEAVALVPDDPDLALLRGQRLLEHGLSFFALDEVERAQQLGARGPAAPALRSRVLHAIGRIEDALTWAVRAYRMSSEAAGSGREYVDQIEMLCQRLLISSPWEVVLPPLDELSRAEALTPFGRALRAEALRLADRPDEAVAEVDAALDAGGDTVRLLGTKASAHIDRGSSREALAVLEDAFALEPGYLFGRSVQLAALVELGRITEALAAVDAYFEPPPDGWEEWATMARGQILNDIGRFSESAKLLEQALARTPDIWDWVGTLGVAYARLDQPSRAAPLLRRAIEGVGASVTAWPLIELGDALAAIVGRCDDDAATQYRRVVELAVTSNIPRTHAAAGWAHFRMDQAAAADEAYDRALSGSDDPMLLERLRCTAMLAAVATDRLPPVLQDVEGRLLALADGAYARALVAQGRYLVGLVGADTRWKDSRDALKAVEERLTAVDRRIESHEPRSL